MPLNVILHFLVYNGPKIGLKKLFIQYHGYEFVNLDKNDTAIHQIVLESCA